MNASEGLFGNTCDKLDLNDSFCSFKAFSVSGAPAFSTRIRDVYFTVDHSARLCSGSKLLA